MDKVMYGSNLGSADTARGPSPTIWGSCPVMDIIKDPNRGVHFFDEFDQFQPLNFATGAVQTTDGGLGGKYRAFCSTAGTWAPDNLPHGVTGSFGGHISALCDTSNDAASIGTLSCPFLLNTAGLAGKLWFEARIAHTQVNSATGNQLFVGLHENNVTAFSATCPLGDGDTACATTAGIGFRRAEAGLTVLDAIHWDHSATETVLDADLGLTALAANTWIKLGMMFDPNNSAAAVRFFVNGIESPTPLTKAALLALTYLDVSGLGPCLAMFAGAGGTAAYVYLDWWRCAQLAP